jgi:hypothetical protein
VLGFCVPWWNRASDATCRVTGYSFPSLNGESGILALWQGSEGSLAVRDSGEGWASMLCGQGSLLAPKSSKVWSMRFTWVCGGKAPGTEWQDEGIHGAAELAGLNCLVPTRQQKPLGLIALGCGLLGAMAALQAQGTQVCR